MGMSYFKDSKQYKVEPFVSSKNVSSDSKFRYRPVISVQEFDGTKWRPVQGSIGEAKWFLNLANLAVGGSNRTYTSYRFTVFAETSTDYIVKIGYTPTSDSNSILYSSFFRVNKQTGALTKFCPNEVSSGVAALFKNNDNGKSDVAAYVSPNESYLNIIGDRNKCTFRLSDGYCISKSQLSSPDASYTKIPLSKYFTFTYKGYAIGESSALFAMSYSGSEATLNVNLVKAKTSMSYGDLVVPISGSYCCAITPNGTVTSDGLRDDAQYLYKININTGSDAAKRQVNTYVSAKAKYTNVYIDGLAYDWKNNHLLVYIPSGGNPISESTSYKTDAIQIYNSNLTLISTVILKCPLKELSDDTLVDGAPTLFYVSDDGKYAFIRSNRVDLTTGDVTRHLNKGDGYTLNYNISRYYGWVSFNSYESSENIDTWDFTEIYYGYDSYSPGYIGRIVCKEVK